jgi:hypothetical protein
MIDNDKLWHYSPLFGYKYLRDHRLLPELKTINDVDKILVHTFKDRLIRDNQYPVDVVYGHQDREFRKLLKTPSLIIENKGIEYLGEIRTERVWERIPNTPDFLVNEHPVYYKFSYKLTTIEDSRVNVYREHLAIQELVFPQVHGQRWITISLYRGEDGNLYEHRKRLTIGEPEYGSFDIKDRYWVSFDIEFFLVLHPLEWEKQYGVTTLRLILEALPDTSVVYWQKDYPL